MFRIRTVVLLLLLSNSTRTALLSADDAAKPADAVPALVFADHFVARTMRVDYFHSGDANQQQVALDRVVADGPWAGPRQSLIDRLELGEFRFEVRDGESQELLFARGFCSVFGEWQTTEPAKTRWGTFHESLRFPWPKRAVHVRLFQRVAGQWQSIWCEQVDPQSRFVTDAESPRRDKVWHVCGHGDPSEKVDIVMLGDGYTRDEMHRFHEDARRLTESLFSVEPFASRRSDFNVRAIDVPAAESGVSRPREKRFRRSPLGCQYNTFDLPRYALTFDNRTLRDVAAQTPYDYLIILLNEEMYGGGGIYNDQTVVAAHHDLSPYVLIHEFGHHLGGLGDEYYSSNVAYETGKPITVEPWEPNVTALLAGQPLKWLELVDPDTPIPTPWDKSRFEKASREPARQAASTNQPTETPPAPSSPPPTLLEILSSNQYYGQVGAFEGARYESRGLYRPSINCAMFSRSTSNFCPVCRQAIERVMDTHCGRTAKTPVHTAQ